MAGRTEKLERALESGDYYAALQLYRTIVKRKVDSGALEDACALLVSGASILCKHGKASEALDLADVLVKTVCVPTQPLSRGVIDTAITICSCTPPVAVGGGLRFIKAAIKWAVNAPLTPEDDGEGSTLRADRIAQLHLAAAKLAVSGGTEFYSNAQRHFLEAAAPTEFAAFLLSWSSGGYKTERDLFLARAVLQLLALGNLRDANAVREHFTRPDGGVVLDTPLSNFLRFLLLTLERDARPLFETLQEKYAPSIARDPSFREYLQAIGQRFYRIAVPQSGMAAMMKNMMGMLGGSSSGGSSSEGSTGAGFPGPFQLPALGPKR